MSFFSNLLHNKRAQDMNKIKEDGMYLEHINEQSQRICLEAVKQNGNALKYVHNPNIKICVEAFFTNYESLIYVPEKLEFPVVRSIASRIESQNIDISEELDELPFKVLLYFITCGYIPVGDTIELVSKSEPRLFKYLTGITLDKFTKDIKPTLLTNDSSTRYMLNEVANLRKYNEDEYISRLDFFTRFSVWRNLVEMFSDLWIALDFMVEKMDWTVMPVPDMDLIKYMLHRNNSRISDLFKFKDHEINTCLMLLEVDKENKAINHIPAKVLKKASSKITLNEFRIYLHSLPHLPDEELKFIDDIQEFLPVDSLPPILAYKINSQWYLFSNLIGNGITKQDFLEKIKSLNGDMSGKLLNNALFQIFIDNLN